MFSYTYIYSVMSTISKLINPSTFLHHHHVCVCVRVRLCWDHLRSTVLESFQYNITINYDHHAALWVSQTYSSCITETSHTLTHLRFPHLPVPTLLTISMNLTFWDFTCKWGPAVFVLLCLAHLLQIMSSRGLPVALVIKNPLAIQETQEIRVQALGQEDPLKEEM